MSVHETISAPADGPPRKPAEERRIDDRERDNKDGGHQTIDTGDMGQGSFEESFAGARDEPVSGQMLGRASVEDWDESAKRSQ